ncbi:ABC transporter substrate-binding protein, partial [Mesotoga sp. UBA5825]|uniref:ABC transporter substrate-binding protein n=1 Tax=Mesotoga sp. UBA5825 TaxID=1946858 RepID=UPI0026011BB7
MKKLLVLVLLCLSIFAFGKTTINFWHAMSGSRLGAVDAIIEGFNLENPDIEVIAQFTGSYAETLTKAIASYRAGDAPHVVQVYEVGLQTMLDSNAIKPVFELAGPDFDWGDVIGPILDYYTVGDKLYSMPFNSSSAILYYNKDIFRAAGLDPNKPPSTFDELYEMGKKIVESGAAQGGISFGWPAWVFEQMHSVHGQFYSNNENGRVGKATEVFFNGDFGVKVLAEWIKWAQAKVFLYGGREYDANQAFLTKQVAMLIQSTSSVSSIESKADFEMGTTFLPVMPGYPKGNSVIGGATLWVMKGHTDEEYEAIWKFFQYLMKTEVTAEWHKSTGYFPTTNSAVKKLMDEGWFAENPNHLTAFLQILSGTRIPEAQGVRLGNFVAIRDVVDGAIEKAIQYTGTNFEAEAKRILDDAAKKANTILEEYTLIYGK